MGIGQHLERVRIAACGYVAHGYGVLVAAAGATQLEALPVPQIPDLHVQIAHGKDWQLSP